MLKLQIGAGIHCKNPLLTFLLKILSKVLLKPKPKRVLRWKTSPILGSILLNFFDINFFNINVIQGEIQLVKFIFCIFYAKICILGLTHGLEIWQNCEDHESQTLNPCYFTSQV